MDKPAFRASLDFMDKQESREILEPGYKGRLAFKV
jgi:hypothetical protein